MIPRLQTGRGGGKNTPKEKQQKEITILDVFENAASVKLVASAWIDHLHVAKFNGRSLRSTYRWTKKGMWARSGRTLPGSYQTKEQVYFANRQRRSLSA